VPDGNDERGGGRGDGGEEAGGSPREVEKCVSFGGGAWFGDDFEPMSWRLNFVGGVNDGEGNGILESLENGFEGGGGVRGRRDGRAARDARMGGILELRER
jgi:hypothetical protein